jgi:Flp pilus assembly protein TadG
MPEERVTIRVRRETTTPASRPRRLNGDRGAVIAEAALLTPIFVALLFGILEFGGAYRDYLTLANATSVGARQAAIQGNSVSADWYILNAIKKATAAMPQSQILAVVVYDASKATDPATVTSPSQVNSGCLTGSVANYCNFYGPSQIPTAFAATTPPANYQDCTVGDPEANYCPTTRGVSLATGVDYVGVYVKITHPWITGLFGNSLTMTSNSVIQLEPQKLTS